MKKKIKQEAAVKNESCLFLVFFSIPLFSRSQLGQYSMSFDELL